MDILSTKFGGIIQSISEDSVPSDSYLGVFIHAYRRKQNISRKQLSILCGINEDSILRVEYGFGSKDEIKLILSKIQTNRAG